MGIFISINYTILWFLLGYALRGVPTSAANEYQHVLTACSYTRYPSTCAAALSSYQSADVLSALVDKTYSETKLPLAVNMNELMETLSAHPHENVAHSTVDYCNELMSMSLKRLNQSLSALKKSPKKYKADIQTWLSAVLTYQETCRDSVLSVGLAVEDQLVVALSKRMDYLSQLGSNALALVNRISGEHNRRRVNEEERFPSWVSAKSRKLLQSSSIQANAVVAQDGTGDYSTISEAIGAASGNRFVIHVKSGIYKEKIHTNKDGITLIGDGKYSTIITGSGSNGGGSSLLGSATFSISGDGFIARDIGFQNTAGPGGEQAVALTVNSDHAILTGCSISGYQDTLYAMTNRQFYKGCDILGTIDFIFGNAAAVFQSCNILLRRPKGSNAILASGRSDPGQNTGLVLQQCIIKPSPEFASVKHNYESYLGRPWKRYARSVVMQSSIDDVISPRGWLQWSGSGGLSTLYFAEYANTGPGADTSKRVQWAGFHVLNAAEASKFSSVNFLGFGAA